MAEHKRRLNIAMIGSGFVAAAHSNAFHQVGRFFEVPLELCPRVVCGRDQARLQTFAQRWGWQGTATDWQAVVTRGDIQIVDIAVPNALHAPIAIAAAQAGKIVLCEKPLAVSADEARQMVSAVGKAPSLVWFNYRRVPAIALARQLIEDGHIGRVFHYRACYFNQSGTDPSKGHSWRYRRSEAGSGAMGDLLSHLLDTALYLNGDIREISALTHTFASGRDVDDAVMLMARFANGSLGSFEASRFGTGRRNGQGFEIYGSKGSLAFDLEDMNWLRYCDATEPAPLQGSRKLLATGPDHPYSANFWKPGHTLGYEHTFIATLGDFLQALAENQAFHPDFEDGLKVQKLLAATELAALSSNVVNV